MIPCWEARKSLKSLIGNRQLIIWLQEPHPCPPPHKGGRALSALAEAAEAADYATGFVLDRASAVRAGSEQHI